MTSKRMDPTLAHGLQLLAAARTLPADAAPLVAALIRDGCITVPCPEAMLATLETLGQAGAATSSDAAQRAIVAAWRASQGRAPGAEPDLTHWHRLADLGVAEPACAAVLFAFEVAHAGAERAACGEVAPLLH